MARFQAPTDELSLPAFLIMLPLVRHFDYLEVMNNLAIVQQLKNLGIFQVYLNCFEFFF